MDYYLKIKNNGKVCIICQEMRFKMELKDLEKEIENIIFDIGNVILNFNVDDVLQKFTSDRNEQKFILDNIINSPEWLGNALIDTGYITRENAIEIVKDRTNHVYDNLITDFWYNYNNFAQHSYIIHIFHFIYKFYFIFCCLENMASAFFSISFSVFIS